jgi:predicted phosphodiesterase
MGVYNIYSGVYDLFKNNDINVDVAICGHTHRPVRLECTEDNKSIRCYNIGNDYLRKTNELKYEIIEI